MTNTTEKTEEQIARDKSAVDAMRNAKSNMDAALARITDLERSLAYSVTYLSAAKGYISSNVYCYLTGGTQQSVHQRIDAEIAQLRKTLG